MLFFFTCNCVNYGKYANIWLCYHSLVNFYLYTYHSMCVEFLLNLSSCHRWQPHARTRGKLMRVCFFFNTQDANCTFSTVVVIVEPTGKMATRQLHHVCYCIKIITVVAVTEQLSRHWALWLSIHVGFFCLFGPWGPIRNINHTHWISVL